MKIGVMSDTHGNLWLMQKIADLMIKKHKVDAIVHLGDDYADAMLMHSHGVPVYAVPGIFEDAWNESSIPRRLLKEFEGVLFLLSHTPNLTSHDAKGDIDPSLALSKFGANVLLHGHTHEHRIENTPEGLIIIDPGHLKSGRDRDRPPTFAVIEATKSIVEVKIFNVDGSLVVERRLTLSA